MSKLNLLFYLARVKAYLDGQWPCSAMLGRFEENFSKWNFRMFIPINLSRLQKY